MYNSTANQSLSKQRFALPNKKHIFKYVFPALFLFAALAVLEAETKSPIYINLQDSPLYFKSGFSVMDTVRLPDSPEWQVFPAGTKMRTVRELDFPDKPQRVFLSPAGAEEREFTLIIPFTMDYRALMALTENHLSSPGIFFASLGDNWEIYLNGYKIKSEMHLDKEKRIRSHRAYRNIYFPVEGSLFAKDNILAIRVAGDPTYDVGFFYTAPYYIDEYPAIAKNNDETIRLILIGVYIFMGLYHLFMFFLRKKDLHNFYYGLFSLALGIYFLARTTAIYHFIPDTNILIRMELFCVMLVFPLGAAFMEYVSFKKIFIFTKILGIFFAALAVSQCLFSLPYSLDTLTVWQYGAIAAALSVLGHDICYSFIFTARNLKKQMEANGERPSPIRIFGKTFLETPLGNILLGALVSLATAVFDLLDSMFLHWGITLSQYGFFLFTAGTALILAQRFSKLYSQQERVIIRSNKGMNPKLVDWIVVQDKDPYTLPSVNVDNVIMFTDVRDFTKLSEGMTSKVLTDFLGALNEVLGKPLFDYEDRGIVAYTDKFIGDGTMNIFTDAEVSLLAAVKIRQQLEKFNANPRSFFKDAQEEMKVNIGTGLAYGPVTLGIMGHSRRIDYTPIGDTVNLASRLESLTKVYRTPILINDALYQRIQSPSFYLRHIDRIRVKGKEQPVDIYEEFSSNSPHVRDMKLALLPRFKELQDLYFSGKDWNGAIALAEELSGEYRKMVERCGLGADSFVDYLPDIYIKRIHTMLANPALAANWDGVYTFTSK